MLWQDFEPEREIYRAPFRLLAEEKYSEILWDMLQKLPILEITNRDYTHQSIDIPMCTIKGTEWLKRIIYDPPEVAKALPEKKKN